MKILKNSLEHQAPLVVSPALPMHFSPKLDLFSPHSCLSPLCSNWWLQHHSTILTSTHYHCFFLVLGPIFSYFCNSHVTLPTNWHPFQNKLEPQQPDSPQTDKSSVNPVEVVANLMGLFCPVCEVYDSTHGRQAASYFSFHVFTKQSYTQNEGSVHFFFLP